jgi:hypothetical protein
MQTPTLAGFGEARPVEVVSIRLPWTVDASALDECTVEKKVTPRATTYVCTILNPTPITSSLIRTDQSQLETFAGLPESNRYREVARARLQIIALPDAIHILIELIPKPKLRGYDIPLGFESREEAISVAKSILEAQPGGRIGGTLLLQYAR